MKRALCLILAVTVLTATCALWASAVGSDAAVTVTAPATVTENGNFDITVTIEICSSEKAATLVEFSLVFDDNVSAAFEIQTNPSDTSFIINAPGAWEQMVSKTGNKYVCSFNPADGGLNVDGTPTESCLSAGETLVISLPFSVKAGTAGNTSDFSVQDISIYDADDPRLSTLLSCDVSAASSLIEAAQLPVRTLGAQINTRTSSLRLGAYYSRELLGLHGISVEDITDLGLIFCPTRFLTGELTKATPGIVSVSATAIVEYDEAKSFVDYEGFTFYASIIKIPANGLKTEISFRAFLSTEETDIYAEETLSRSYQYVHDVIYGTNPGTENIELEEGDNIIYYPSNWFD